MSAPDDQQTALLDLDGQELNAMWVDESQPLFIANNPLHWKAHKFQLIVARLEKQAVNNPAQFNSTSYINAVDKLGALMEQIKGGQNGQVLESGKVDGGLPEYRGSEVSSEGKPDGVDSDVRPYNPFTGQGLPAA
jgi:hypothetical protein